MAIDQGQSQSSQQGVGSKQGLFGRIAGDFRAGKRFIAAKAQGRSLAHKKQETEGQLLASFQKVGDQAASLGIGTNLPSFQQVQTHRGQLATAEDALQDKAAATRRAEADLAAEMQRHSAVVSPLEAELKPLMAAMAAAQQSLEAIQRDARSIDAQTNKVKADLANPPQGTAAVSPEELRRTLSGLEESKRAIEPRQTEANKQHGQAKQMADAKAAQVSAAKQELNKAKSKGEADVATAKAAETEATKAVGAGKIALTRSLQSFGKAVFEANTSDPKLATDTAQAKTLIAEIADMDTKIKLADAEAAASKGGTTRAAIYVGGALVVIVVLVLILSSLLGGRAGSRRDTVGGGRGSWGNSSGGHTSDVTGTKSGSEYQRGQMEGKAAADQLIDNWNDSRNNTPVSKNSIKESFLKTLESGRDMRDSCRRSGGPNSGDAQYWSGYYDAVKAGMATLGIAP